MKCQENTEGPSPRNRDALCEVPVKSSWESWARCNSNQPGEGLWVWNRSMCGLPALLSRQPCVILEYTGLGNDYKLVTWSLINWIAFWVKNTCMKGKGLVSLRHRRTAPGFRVWCCYLRTILGRWRLKVGEGSFRSAHRWAALYGSRASPGGQESLVVSAKALQFKLWPLHLQMMHLRSLVTSLNLFCTGRELL